MLSGRVREQREFLYDEETGRSFIYLQHRLLTF